MIIADNTFTMFDLCRPRGLEQNGDVSYDIISSVFVAWMFNILQLSCISLSLLSVYHDAARPRMDASNANHFI